MDTPESAKDLQGRVKQAAGDLSGNDRLKHEGKLEQAGEKLKAGIDKATEKGKDALHTGR